jgi:2-dehydro-3-deoxy-D-arabinonate dehydratase
MKLCRYHHRETGIGAALVEEYGLRPLLREGQPCQLGELLEADDVAAAASQLLTDRRFAWGDVELLPPIDQQEVWAAGVTYVRSKTARMEESTAAASCYDRVYVSERPELFFKATPHRVSGHGQPVRIRQDATWNVPEPELALVLSSQLRLVGHTIGNDMSSRDIEGENPLYLPQAKVYNQCCGLGPWITLAAAMPPEREIGIRLRVCRGSSVVFHAETSTSQLARSFADLVQWLGRDNSFPRGAFLLTGTGIVPDSSFTLLDHDEVHISIDGIGTLTSPVVQG